MPVLPSEKMLSIVRPDQIVYLPWYWRRQSFCVPLAAAIFSAARFGSTSKLTRFYSASTDLEKSVTRSWLSLLTCSLEETDGQTILLPSWIKLENGRFLVLSGRLDHRKWAVDWVREQVSQSGECENCGCRLGNPGRPNVFYYVVVSRWQDYTAKSVSRTGTVGSDRCSPECTFTQ
jgi:hypothetical protein